ncbi:MAG TPA: hypothetical protein VFM16_01215 [Holophagaceae bacterium]|nr:hypothetical protein [Holophagaceae bacterium]
MSFVERHKTWLLPLLAVGVGAVIWYDLGSLGAPPAPASASAPSPGNVPAAASAPAPPEAPAAPAADGAAAPSDAAPGSASARPPLGPDAWADLRYLNTVPGTLGDASGLATRATRPLDPDQLTPPASGPAPVRLEAPSLLVLPQAGAGEATPPPELDFISRTPEGLRAWYQGLGFRAGETILGTGYRIREIHPPRVVLEGPSGPVVQSTVRLERPAPPQETP